MLNRRDALRNFVYFLAGSPLFAQRSATVYPPFYSEEVNAPVDVFDIEDIAKKKLHKMAYDFIAGGVEGELTLRANREALEKIRLRPRTMVDVSKIDSSTELLGKKLDYPILLAPTGGKNLVIPEGDRIAAQAAFASKALYCVGAGGWIDKLNEKNEAPVWWQNTIGQATKRAAEGFAKRSEEAGAAAIVVTVDNQYQSNRERNNRNRFDYNYMQTGVPDDASKVKPHTPAVAAMILPHTPNMTWDYVDWLHGACSLPVVLKGILTAEDARIAVERGAAAIVVSQSRRAATGQRDADHPGAARSGGGGQRKGPRPDGRRHPPRHRRSEGPGVGRQSGLDRTALRLGPGGVRTGGRAARARPAALRAAALDGPRGQAESRLDRSQPGAAAGGRLVRAWLLVPLLVAATPASALRAQKQHELCGVCHSEEAKDFLTHPHFQKGLECNVCHGDSTKHREAEGHTEPDKVAAPAEIPALCGACHTGKGPKSIVAEYSGSTHGKFVLQPSKVRAPHCGTCHGVHARREGKAIETQCRRCHTTLPTSCSGKPPRQAAVSCAACHNPHTLARRTGPAGA